MLLGDQASLEDIAQARQRPIPVEAVRQFASVGLANAGVGTYYVTHGRNFMLNQDGEPLVINVLDLPAKQPK